MKRIFLTLTLLVLCLPAFGANEIYQFYSTGHTTLYAVVARPADVYTYDALAAAFALSPTWTDCDIPLTEHTLQKGWYYANFPALAAGKYVVRIFNQVGASPANTDTIIDNWPMDWDGTEELAFSVLMTSLVTSADLTTPAEIKTAIFSEARNATPTAGSIEELFYVLGEMIDMLNERFKPDTSIGGSRY